MMKMITAIINPIRVYDVRSALNEIGINGMTVTEVKGLGRQRGHAKLYRGEEYAVEFLPKTKIEIAVSDDSVDEVMKVIIDNAKSGKVGDGKIFITDLESAVRIRTGERDDSAL